MKMKEKLLKVLHLFGLDALLWGLFEKITRGLTKKLKELKNAVANFLNRVFHRNGKRVCACPEIA